MIGSRVRIITEMRCALLHYYRFKIKGICANEVRQIACPEVLAFVNNESIEIGLIKNVNQIDKDFITTLESEDCKHNFKPHKFLFCIPVDQLTYDAIEEIENYYTMYDYGILGYDQSKEEWQDKIRVIRRAISIHDDKSNSNMIRNFIAAKTTSELAEFYKCILE